MLICAWELTFYYCQHFLLFSWNDSLTSFIFKNMSAKYPNLNNHSLSFRHPFKIAFAWYNCHTLVWSRSALVYFSFHCMGIKKHGDLRKLMFIASSGAFVTKTGFFSFYYYMDFKVQFCDIPSVSALCAHHPKIKILLSPSIWPLDP